MRRWTYLLVFPFVLLSITCPIEAMVRAGVEVDSNAGSDDDVDVQIIVWDGPGFYYGIWFGNERDYNNWYYHHHHDHDDHDHHDHHDDHNHNNGGNGHHGSGGHHGGGGGGHRNGNGGAHPGGGGKR